ncbi:MAG: sigma-70 family RNA polymerase sigma factor [Bacteroidota bacterium]
MKIEQYQQVWNLWEAYEGALKKYVFKYTQNEQITEDIVQDSLLKVHKSCCSDREIRNVRSWLFQITHNAMLDTVRRSKNERIAPLNKAPDQGSDIYRELSIYIEPLIGFLPEKYATPLQMADIQGLKQQAIADQLGLSLSAVKSRVWRARKLLKEEIHSCFHVQACSTSGLTDFKLKQSCTPLQKWQKQKK